MLDIIEKEIEFDETLKMRIELICKLAHVKPVFHNGSVKKINHSNLVYVEPHRIEVKDKVIHLSLLFKLLKPPNGGFYY